MEEEFPALPDLPPHLLRRSASRLAAVQVLFQHEQRDGAISTKTLLEDLSVQLLENLQDEDEEGLAYEPDMRFLTSIAEGTIAHLTEIDGEIIPRLAGGWRYERIDPVLRALLRVAVYELKYGTDIPARVVMNEYVDVAAAFSPKEETSFVNGLLDRVARSLRPAAEFDTTANG